MNSRNPAFARPTQSLTRRQAGLTMIELLVAVGLMAILATVAVPSYLRMIQRNGVASASNSLVAALTVARSSSVRRNDLVSICPSTGGANPTCSASGDWSKGLLVFADPNADGSFSPSNLIADLSPIDGESGSGLSIADNFSTDHITFSHDGSVYAPSSMPSSGCLIFTVTESGGAGSSSNTVSVNPQGAISTGTGC